MILFSNLSKSFFFLVGNHDAHKGELSSEVLTAQQGVLYRHLVILAVLPIITGTLVTLGLITMHPPLPVLCWYLAYMALPITLLILYLKGSSRKARQSPGKERTYKAMRRPSGRLLRQAENISLISGTIWGITAPLFGVLSEELLGYISVILISHACGFAQLVTATPRIVFRFTATALMPVTVMLMLRPSLFLTTLGLLSLAVFATIMLSSFTSYRQLRATVQSETRARRAEALLRSSIDAMPDALAVYGFDGKVALENANHKAWELDQRPPASESGERVTQSSNGRWIKHSWNLIPELGTLTIHTDISNQKQREALLIDAREQAQRARGAQSRFLSSVSHELRTPLNSVLGFSELLGPISAQRKDWDIVEEYTQHIHSSGKHLLALINDIIDYTSIGDDGDPVNTRAIDLSKTIKRAVDIGRTKSGVISEHRILLRFKDELQYIKTDGYILERIVSNIVSNSIKFSDPSGKIAISSTYSDAGNPVILIRDFGHGMTPEQLENCFSIFYKADDSHQRQSEGTGLGLALVQKLANLIDVDVKIASKLGRGTVVMLTFNKDSLLTPLENEGTSEAKTA